MHAEFEKFRVQQDKLPSPVEKHFGEAIKKLSSLKTDESEKTEVVKFEGDYI